MIRNKFILNLFTCFTTIFFRHVSLYSSQLIACFLPRAEYFDALPQAKVKSRQYALKSLPSAADLEMNV